MMQSIQKFDLFTDTNKVADDDVQNGLLHVRILELELKLNCRKIITTVQGLSSDYDLKKILKACKKELGCNGKLIEHTEYGRVMQLQGDQRENVCEWLTKAGLIKPDQLKFHGF